MRVPTFFLRSICISHFVPFGPSRHRSWGATDLAPSRVYWGHGSPVVALCSLAMDSGGRRGGDGPPVLASLCPSEGRACLWRGSGGASSALQTEDADAPTALVVVVVPSGAASRDVLVVTGHASGAVRAWSTRAITAARPRSSPNNVAPPPPASRPLASSPPPPPNPAAAARRLLPPAVTSLASSGAVVAVGFDCCAS